MNNPGLLYALVAYFIWGLAPILWKSMDQAGSDEIVAHRMVWACVFAGLLILFTRQWQQFRGLLKQPQLLKRLFIASILISVNWGIYIWAVNAGYIVESAMGYFINPLINVVFGVIFFQERLKIIQVLAVALAAVGVAYLVWQHGRVPVIALALAITFASYGAVKKTLSVDASHGMAIETGFLFIPALAYIFYLSASGDADFGPQTSLNLMFVFAGAVTLAPLVLFSAAAKKISLTTLGMCQYLGPSLQLFIGVWMYNEPFDSVQMVAFSLIWLALIIYTFDQWNTRRRIRLADLPQ